jgi:hypothetical protein
LRLSAGSGAITAMLAMNWTITISLLVVDGPVSRRDVGAGCGAGRRRR